MKRNKRKKYLLRTSMDLFNENKTPKMYGYFKILENLIDLHLKQSKINIGTTIENNYTWIVLSYALEIINPIVHNKDYYGQTWSSDFDKALFRREYKILDENDNLSFIGASYTALADINTHLIVKLRKDDIKNDYKKLGYSFNKEFLLPLNRNYRTNHNYIKIATYKVRPSDIDILGHMHNLSYSNIVYDCLTKNERNDLVNLKRIEMYFKSELSEDDTVTIYKAKEANKLIFTATNNNTNKTAFTNVLEFNKKTRV